MSRGRAQYFLQSDTAQEQRDLQKVHEKSLDQQAGINKYRGIGRGLGTLGGILLAGSGAGIPLLALAGGLGSFAGSHAGKHLGQKKYGAPAQARGGLFHLDTKEKQRESVGDYWKGMKEQIGVNTLQDAITAGMYGSQIQDIFQKGRLALGGQPAGMAMPPSAAASRATIQQPNTAGIFADAPTKLKLPDNMLKKAPVYPTPSDVSGTAFTPSAFKSGVTTSAPSSTYQNVVGYDVPVPPVREINPNALDFEQFDRSVINTGKERTLQALDNAGTGAAVVGAGGAGLNFSTPMTTTATDATGAAISTDLTGKVPDYLKQAIENTGGQITPSLTGNMQQRIAHYKDKGWALDDTIDKTMWDAWSSPENVPDFSNIFGKNFSNYGMQ
tara:strand:- start:43 stop:1197 length:1155 start_codon:yes stop_codon:yes gene_type:complete